MLHHPRTASVPVSHARFGIFKQWSGPCLLAAGFTILASCARLQLSLHNASVQKPSNVALYFSVETNDGKPVGGLAAESFRIYEDDQLISPYESKQTILNPEVAVEHYVLLLLDLSGSITESGSLHSLVSAAAGFAERVTRDRKIAIFGFDGGPKLLPLSGFTSNGRSVTRSLASLSNRRSRDPSTNLNGAIVEAVHELERQMERSRRPLRFGTLVVFTDGTDRAHRVTAEQMSEVLDEANINVFAIGLGAEISTGSLRELGRTGFVQAEQEANIGQAFDEVAETLESSARKFYLLSYCSPSRAGQHRLRVEATAEGQQGALEQDFDANGFGPQCDPKRTPAFRVGRILLRKSKR